MFSYVVSTCIDQIYQLHFKCFDTTWCICDECLAVKHTYNELCLVEFVFREVEKSELYNDFCHKFQTRRHI